MSSILDGEQKPVTVEEYKGEKNPRGERLNRRNLKKGPEKASNTSTVAK